MRTEWSPEQVFCEVEPRLVEVGNAARRAKIRSEVWRLLVELDDLSPKLAAVLDPRD
jgi:hypothetical protein